jgi:hypothetical protein
MGLLAVSGAVLVLAIGGVIGALRGSPGVAVEKERSSAVAPHGSSLAGAPSLSGAASSAPLPSPDPAPEELEKAVAGGLVPLQKLAAGFPESATVLLEIGRAQVAKKDYVAGVLAVARALEIDPEMRRDPRTAGVLFQAAQAKVASAAAFKLLEGPMRERGAAIEHDLAVYAPTGSLAQKHAEAFLRSPRFTAVAEPALQLAVALRRAKTCAQVRALLLEVKAAGDRTSLPYLKFFREHIASYPCLKGDSLLSDTSRVIELRSKELPR